MKKIDVYLSLSIACATTAAVFPISEASAQASAGFYDQVPANLASMQPGTVIASEIETDFLTPFRNSAVAYRILYRSTGQLGNPITVGAMVFVPASAGPSSTLKIVAWNHGTSGVGDQCNPSRWPDMYAGSQWRTYLNQIDELLGEGYLVVATDYEGLGTPGLHPYLQTDSLARSVIDGVRAAKQIVPNAGTQWAAMGHSEGGQASLGAGELAQTYGAGLQYVGAVAYAPANHMYESQALVASDKFSAPYIPYEAVGMKAINPAFSYDAFVGPLYTGMMNDAENHCFDEWFIHDNYRNSPTPETALSANWQTNPVVLQYFANSDVAKRPSAGPVLVLQGTKDGLVTVLPKLMADLCLQHTPAHAILYKNDSHDKVVETGWPDAKAWLAARFAGQAAPNDCP